MLHSPKEAAKELASYGRYGDSLLLHVSPAEVAGIASLIPGGLTTNPDTGLPEAFFFLPFLASLFGAAAPAATAAAAAAPAVLGSIGTTAATAAGAAGTAAATGLGTLGSTLASIPSTLAHGIGSIFGAGAAAPAAIDPIVTGATAAAPAASLAPIHVAAIAPTTAATAAPTLALPSTTTAIPTLKSSLTAVLGNPAGQSYAGTGVATSGPAAVKGAAATLADAPTVALPDTAAIPTPKPGFGSGVMGWLEKNPMLALGGISALSSMFKGSGKKHDKDEDRDPNSLPTYDTVSGAADFSSNPLDAGHIEHNFYPHFNYTPHYANGGIVALAEGGPVDPQAQQPQDQSFPLNGVPGVDDSTGGPPPMEDIPSSGFPTEQIGKQKEPSAKDDVSNDHELIVQAVAALKGKTADPRPILMEFIKAFGEQALQDLAMRVQSLDAKAAGKGQAGPPGIGDGQSDSIPAMIDGKQPAALSQGEFVVPADAVSHLGNGSTDAGAQQLQGMVDGVRQSRTGSAAAPPRLNAGGLIKGYAGGGIVGLADGGSIGQFPPRLRQTLVENTPGFGQYLDTGAWPQSSDESFAALPISPRSGPVPNSWSPQQFGPTDPLDDLSQYQTGGGFPEWIDRYIPSVAGYATTGDPFATDREIQRGIAKKDRAAASRRK